MRIGGLGTGLDTHSMIDQLMKAERIPLDKLKQNRQIWEWKKEDYRTINSSLLNFRHRAFDMRLSNRFLLKTAVSSNSEAVTASPSGKAVDGTYLVNVKQLAAKSFANSTGALSGNPGDKIDLTSALTSISSKFVDNNFGDSFTINGVNFNIDPSSDSLGTIMERVNNSAAGVHMFYDRTEDKVFLSSRETGSGSIALSGTFLTGTLKLDMSDPSNTKIGKDAIVEINGYEITRRSNSFTFGDVTYNIRNVTNRTITIQVKQDSDTIFNNIKSFIDDYNNLLNTLNKKLSEERFKDYMPLTDDKREKLSEKEIEKWESMARSGLLRNNRILSRLTSRIRNEMGGFYSSFEIKSLSAIGIQTLGHRDGGILHIDENRLRRAIEENPEALFQFFGSGSDDNRGLSRKLYDTIDSAINEINSHAGQSSARFDQSFIGRTMRRIDDRILSMEDRLLRIEDRYWRQFTSMEKALSALNEQSMWLSQQLTHLQPKR
jgi:flagellar hook-associated protein 2